MTISLVRVDQRLIHGIVVNQWYHDLKINRFMVIDDTLSKDEDTKAGMRMAKPAGTGVSIISTDTAINNILEGKYDAQDVLILVKEPSTILRLQSAGITIPKVNLGIIFNQEGRVPVTKRVAVNDDERADLDALVRSGVPVTLQYLPSDSEQPWEVL